MMIHSVTDVTMDWIIPRLPTFSTSKSTVTGACFMVFMDGEL